MIPARNPASRLELRSGRGFDEPHQLVAAVTVLASELDQLIDLALQSASVWGTGDIPLFV